MASSEWRMEVCLFAIRPCIPTKSPTSFACSAMITAVVARTVSQRDATNGPILRTKS
jgi:hypothetical protein